jgi:tetratricopeptide (TPR) repeat protein
LAAWVLLAAVGWQSPVSAQDFDPSGRRHGGSHPPTPSGTRPSPAKPPAGGEKPTAGTAKQHSPAPGEARGPGREALIARYTALVLAQPAAPMAMQRLAQLYRERDGNLKQITADFEQRAAGSGPDRHNALLALGALYELDGRFEDAEHAYERAIAERPNDGATLTALARLLRDHGQPTLARQRYEQALAVLPGPDKETTLRALIGLSLDEKDFDAAKRYQRELVRIGQGGLSARAELSRELLTRGEWERAEAELREIVQASAGDNRALAPALRDLGRVLAKEHKNEQALEVLKRALAAAGSEAGVRKEIFEITADVYRSENRLGELIAIIEHDHPGDVQRLSTLAALYEETGQVDQAVATYRRALSVDPRNIDLRLKLVRLLQARGDLEQATREYEGLIRSAPHNPDYVFELCDTLLLRGERTRAVELLTNLEARSSTDDDVLARIADFYDRIGEKQRSIALLARIAARSPGDPQHLVDLGDRYYQQGDKKRAVETWNRIKLLLSNRPKALATLGDVYLEHDMPTEGLDALREAAALEPKNVSYKKSYAMALERTATGAPLSATTTARFEEALGIWEQLLRAADGGDHNLAREARTHLVTLWSFCIGSSNRPRRSSTVSPPSRRISKQGASCPTCRSASTGSPTPKRPCVGSRPAPPATKSPFSRSNAFSYKNTI